MLPTNKVAVVSKMLIRYHVVTLLKDKSGRIKVRLPIVR